MIVMKLKPVVPASGEPRDWLYLKSFDPDGHNGWGDTQLTDNIAEAFRFNSTAHAMEFWRQQSKTKPLRPDGKPNRPLTAYHATFENTGDSNG